MSQWWKKLQQRVGKMGERIKHRLPLLPLIPLVFVFLLSAAMLTRHYIRSAEERRALAELALLAETPETPAPTPVPLIHPTPVPAPAAPAVLSQYQALHEQKSTNTDPDFRNH